MSRTAFHRPARTFPPAPEEQRLTLPAPPQKSAENGASALASLLLPLLSSVSMAAYMISFGRSWMVLLGGTFIVASVGTAFLVRAQSKSQNRRTLHRRRDRYTAHLAVLRAQARASAAAQRFSGGFLHPSPVRLLALAHGGRRVWERRPTDTDFLRLRLGTGAGTPALQLVSANRADPTADQDPESQRAADRLVRDHATVRSSPAWVDLASCGVVSLLGPPGRTRSAARALAVQLAVLHAPDDVQLAVLAADPDAWAWAKWLPHTREEESTAPRDRAVPMVAEHLDGLADILEARLEAARRVRADRPLGGLTDRQAPGGPRHLVVVLDGYRPDADWARRSLVAELVDAAGPRSGIHVVCLTTREEHEPGRVDARVRVGADGSLVLESRLPALVAQVAEATADDVDAALCEHVARALAPLRLTGDQEQVLSRAVPLRDMLGLGDLDGLDPTRLWRAPDDEELLRLPIGVTGDGTPLVLDLKESAQGGIGPHGLVVGATGSGKSELLRTLVTALTATHAPEHLSFVLVDFKGGATFAGVTELPHVAGLITNLADDLALVDRMRAALQGEQQRRQRMLREAGNVDSVREYQVLHASGATDTSGRPLEPMPYLMVVVDEFGELLSQRPDFIDLFVQIGRVGRSLGIHLLLATQRLDEGRLRGLESHLSYRICLRTFSAAESRTVIGTPDAYTLPPIPGSAYLKVDESVYERFRVAHISGPHRERGDEPPAVPAPPVPFGLRTPEHAGAGEAAAAEPPAAPRTLPGRRTEMQVLVERIARHGSPAHQVWLPPLPALIEADSLLAPFDADQGGRGFESRGWSANGSLSFPIGVVDLPLRQEQRVLPVDLAGAHGHLAVVGAPQSGKSTLLRTALLSAMLTHTPEELQVLAVDLGGGTLAGLEAAPHVRGVATRHDEARVRRALATARRLLEEREVLFGRLHIDSAAEFRALRAEGRLPEGTDASDVVLVVDNWAALREAEEDADPVVHAVATRGLGVGLHLLLTANRWTEIRPSLRDNIAGRLELRTNEPGESEVSRPAARLLRTGPAGRGIAAPGNVFQTALPRIDGLASLDDLAKAQAAAVADLAAAWTGPRAPELRILPERVTPAALAAARSTAGGPARPGEVPIGLRESDLGPAHLDLEAGDPHFLLLGDSGSGKTTFLRSWMRTLARNRSAWDVRFVVVDYRRGLLDAVPEEYLGAHAGDPVHAQAYVEQVLAKLEERTPPPGVTAQELRERTWWSGPEIYLVIDDYDLVASGTTARTLLAPITDHLTQAADTGFHLVLSRRVAGMARAQMSEPLIGRLRESGTGGLLLSGDPREGVVLGDHRAVRRPPGRGLLVSRTAEPEVVQVVDDGPDD
ncbi:type VII secretion protein EccCa [Streptacidiphilus sp. ASG 303]|uniref:type VII secretion protein EccCa n=1 Tax=Streptacidiphilus sp. ASG 303 TaxID=2896847 RepID=UPI001E2A6714|nr:type VII secretion protein EccCa [Streptacidiphilus sp. ASG 303]MCD0484789.1 type VII secretion protein EccCa [Streptacidiphilus sp. ASG 303]